MAVMQGDVIIVEEQHRRVAETIAERLLDRIRGANRIYTVTVAGESGSGKSETATAIKEALKVRGLRAEILQQDDYFVFPPKTNDGRRRADIGWVGPGEVRLDLLDEHLAKRLDWISWTSTWPPPGREQRRSRSRLSFTTRTGLPKRSCPWPGST